MGIDFDPAGFRQLEALGGFAVQRTAGGDDDGAEAHILKILFPARIVQGNATCMSNFRSHALKLVDIGIENGGAGLVFSYVASGLFTGFKDGDRETGFGQIPGGSQTCSSRSDDGHFEEMSEGDGQNGALQIPVAEEGLNTGDIDGLVQSVTGTGLFAGAVAQSSGQSGKRHGLFEAAQRLVQPASEIISGRARRHARRDLRVAGIKPEHVERAGLDAGAAPCTFFFINT